MKNIKQGFTLIELLVVIAIIGMLASIVLVSLSSARNKGRDARVISDIQQIRATLESGFNGYGYPDLLATNAQCYGATSITGNIATNANCANTSGPGNATIQTLINDANNQGGANTVFLIPGVVGSNATSYALRGRLVSSPTLFFCIDSVGRANQADNNVVTAAACHP